MKDWHKSQRGFLKVLGMYDKVSLCKRMESILNVKSVGKKDMSNHHFLKEVVENIVRLVVEVKMLFMQCLQLGERVGGKMYKNPLKNSISFKIPEKKIIRDGKVIKSVILESMTGLPNTTDNRHIVRIVDSKTQAENITGQIYQASILET